MTNTNSEGGQIWEWSDLIPLLLCTLGGLFIWLSMTVLPTWIHRMMIVFAIFLLSIYMGKTGWFIIGPTASGVGSVVFACGAGQLVAPHHSTPVQVGLLLLSVCGLFVWHNIRRAEFAAIQAARDKIADEILNAVRGGVPPRYALYLRPFVTRNRLLIQSFYEPDGDLPGTEQIDLETILALSFQQTIPIISLPDTFAKSF